MEDGRFDNIIQNLIENKIDQLSNNEIFGLVSLLTLMEIITVFDKQSSGLNLPADSNLKQIVNSLQSGSQAGNNTELQHMLPLLLKLMGGSGELENLGNLSSLLGLLKKQNRESTTATPDEEGERETETTSPDQSKKKTII